MKTLLLATLLLSMPALAQDTTRLRWVPNPRVSNGGWVADPARHLKPETVARVNTTIATLERETSAEIAVVVADSLDGLEPAAAALLLHRRWGVGKMARDNGIVLLWSPKLRKTHVSIGYGLEGVLTDGRAGRIQDQAIIPRFRVNDFDGGIIAGVEALAAAAREEKYTGLPRARSLSAEPRAVPGRGDGSSGGFFALMASGLAAMLGGMGLWVRRRPKRCPKGHGAMRRLGESQDDAYLVKEAILEEKLGSMNYDVWLCNTCDERLIVARRKWFTSYVVCPECRRRTVQVDTKQLRAATYSSTGEREVTRTCRNCRWRTVDHETIPMLVRSSSSSSGGGSGGGGGGGGGSFGGGTSGGGGAGRSY